MTPFQPLFRNPHLQTIFGHYWPRPRIGGSSEQRLFRTEADVRVMVESNRPHGAAKGEILLVHGLEGSSNAVYMRGLAGAAVLAGYAAHRLNLRTCGGTEHLCKTLYHAGLTSDAASVLAQLRAERSGPFFLIGFSLGGNLVLKLAGELGEQARGWLAGVAAVSTPLDLAVCVRRIGERDNRRYEDRFLSMMRKRMCATGRYRKGDFSGVRTLWDVDNRITAPAFGFAGADEYYRTQSSLPYLGRIRVPALLLHSKDDTYIPAELYERPEVRANPLVTVIETGHGGHLGFLGRGPQRFWMDYAIMDWVVSHTARESAVSTSQS
jgi:hypothetical protein